MPHGLYLTVTALDGVDLAVAGGSIYALLGLALALWSFRRTIR